MDKPLCDWCKENDFSEGCHDCHIKPTKKKIRDPEKVMLIEFILMVVLFYSIIFGGLCIIIGPPW